MRNPLATALVLALLATPAFSHGGQYKGPSDAGGPSASGGGQAAPPTNPGGAAAPGPGAPASGAAPTGAQTGAGRGKGSGPPQTGGPEIDEGATYEIWEFWWENNKDQYLNLKNRLVRVTSSSGSSTVLTGRGRQAGATSSRRANEQQILTDVIPALLQLLAKEDNRDILDSDVLALGRMSREEQAQLVIDAAQPLLAHRELSVQTAASLSLGVLDSPKAISILKELMANTSRGQQLSGGGDVPWLSRAFAALSLGIINEPDSVGDLINIVKNSPDSDKDIKVCAIVALGLMDNARTNEAYDFLVGQLEERKLDAVIKSYIPTSLGKMANGTRIEAVPVMVKTFLNKDTDNFVRQSCAIGLGLLARMQDAEAIKALHQYVAEGKDMQTRHFCFTALAEIGKRDKDQEAAHADQHEALKDLFMREMSKPSTKSNRSWAALAGAIYAKDIASAAPDIITVLEKAYDKESDPSYKAAFALSLGLLNVSSAGDKIHQDFKENKDEDFRGYAAVALGFMQHTAAAEDLREFCKSKTIGPTFRLQVATGLGLMGDTEAVDVLIETLRAAETLGVSSAVAKALGLIGDQAAIGPLKDIANDEKMQPITRAFACVALGIVCEKSDLPWNARISADNNYRARVPAIDEVLDIL